MAHQISITNGVAELAYSGKTPWHQLGTDVGGLQRAGDMIDLAHMAWTVGTEPIYLGLEAGGERIPGYVAIRRQDTGATFGVASDRYTPIQNRQAADVMDALVTEGGAHVEVAGALGAGERCWMLAQLPDAFEVLPGDRVNPYILLAWGHDGKHGLAAKLTPIRVVCNNTLTAALGDKWSRTADVYVRHTKNARVQLDEARRALGLVRRQVEETAAAYQGLAATKLEPEVARDYFERVFPRPADTAERVVTREVLERWQSQQTAITGLYRAGRGLHVPGVAGTAWGAYNAVTEWADHVYPVLQSGQVSPLRQTSVLFGGYGEVKAKALTEALALVG